MLNRTLVQLSMYVTLMTGFVWQKPAGTIEGDKNLQSAFK